MSPGDVLQGSFFHKMSPKVRPRGSFIWRKIMLIRPIALASSELAGEELKEDKKKCIKIGPCGIGEKAFYMNSFFFDRVYYAEFTRIERVFKRIAMSKGGFSGKGLFASIPYLVVKFKDGSEKSCNFKYEEDVDIILEKIHQRFPEMPVHSKEAEKRLEEARKAEEARYLKNLSPEAEKSVELLKSAEKVMEKKGELSIRLAHDAKQKRTLDAINPTYRIFALAIFAAAIICAMFGIKMVAEQGFKTGGVYVLAGFAFIFFIVSANVLPSGRNNKKYGDDCYRNSLDEMEKFLSGRKDFPLPAAYAHPIVLERMIRVIREGRTEKVGEALEIVKTDLKALNPSVTVTQKEYDEVVVIKPMFTVNGYSA